MYLANIDKLRADHPSLVMTQFFGPYVLTDPTTTQARKDVNVAWIKKQHDMFGDEIGVHIHPWCNFVQTVLSQCRATPSSVDPQGDATGYTTIFAAYTVDEQTQLLQGASDLLEANGLGRPTSFRAGGWTADLGTIQAVQAAGYTVESSALPASTIQQAWAGYVLASWNAANWAGITETSQPYFPSTTNLVSDTPGPDMLVLEVPDNGCLVDYMTSAQMIDVLNQNWPTSHVALATPTVFQVGFHPPDFMDDPPPYDFLARMEGALDEVDKHLYSDDNGPIRYARLVDLTKVWVPKK
jgi:hypothetical protein